jgi:DNA modification methylase
MRKRSPVARGRADFGDRMQHRLIVGDCRDVLATFDAASIDAIVTDPPYGLGFMGKGWDHGVPGIEFWEVVFRVAKPGAHLLAFGGTRTHHRLMCAIEDAGFEIRDCLMWLYGSGFPKSLDVSKAMDKAAGAEREIVGEKTVPDGRTRRQVTGEGNHAGWDRPWKNDDEARSANFVVTAPATDLAREWEGWGTALKPAWEPIILARKPLIGTVAANVERYSTGAINVDACRIDVVDGEDRPTFQRETERSTNVYNDGLKRSARNGQSSVGRWPANLCLDEEAAAMLDAEVGDIRAGDGKNWSQRKSHGTGQGSTFLATKPTGQHYSDTGSASRFFYCAKASRSERNAGLGDKTNQHPTVKPVALMRWLVRLITPPGGVVLDPFCGSGTTGVACEFEGFDSILIDEDPESIETARLRVAWARGPLFAWPRGGSGGDAMNR